MTAARSARPMVPTTQRLPGSVNRRAAGSMDAAEGRCAAAGGAVKDGGAGLTTGGDAASRERTRVINALVSAAGSTRDSTATPLPDSSYTLTAPPRAPRSARGATQRGAG